MLIKLGLLDIGFATLCIANARESFIRPTVFNQLRQYPVHFCLRRTGSSQLTKMNRPKVFVSRPDIPEPALQLLKDS